MKAAVLAALAAAVLSVPAAELPLPGEPATKPAVSPSPFPDALSAYVWRNWFVVPHDVLASVIGAKPSDLAAVAAEMGLPADPVVLPDWRTRGYITVLRRNWHLLPYEQLLPLLGKTREELRFCLVEDDFLFTKLGRIKPKCEPVVYSSGLAEKGRARRLELAKILREEGVDPAAPEEPRFTFVKELSAVDSAFRAPPPADSPFDFRLIFSYFADYGDPLWDEEIGSYPEGLLQKLSAQGVNAVWLHTVLRTLVRDPRYPEFGEGSERRLRNLQKLVDRAAKYGVKVYLYMNEPRALDPGFFEKPGRGEIRGAVVTRVGGTTVSMCTSAKETNRWVTDSVAQVFRTVRGLGGVFTITASENHTNCANNPGYKEKCPRCRDRTRGEIIAAATRALVEGVAKGDPAAETLVFNWAWPKEEEAAIMDGLPKGARVRIMSVSENGMKIRRGGVEVTENDYSISIVGPGERARRTWKLAGERGFGRVAKVQVNNSWELSPFPYLPVMDLVAQHAVNLAAEGVDGVMLSWSCGCCPAVNLRVYRELRRGETTIGPVLDRFAAELYGAANVPRVRQAWKAFSDGFAQYPFAISVLYDGVQHWGPANPLYAEKTGWDATMVGIPYDCLAGWRNVYPADVYIDLMGKVADGFERGCGLLEGIAPAKELAMFRAETMHFASCRDQARFVLARDAGDRGGMRRWARAELDRAKAYLPLVRADSRIGYESSNHYFFIPVDVMEKILSCRVVLDRTRPERAGCAR